MPRLDSRVVYGSRSTSSPASETDGSPTVREGSSTLDEPSLTVGLPPRATAIGLLSWPRRLQLKGFPKLCKRQLSVAIRNLEKSGIHLERDFRKLHRHLRAVL